MSQLASLPQIVLAADGRMLSAEETRSMGEVRVQQRLSMPTLCELVFRDPPGPLSGVEALVPGAEVSLKVGDHQVPLFSGQVTVVEHSYGPSGAHEVRVRGYDLLHRLRKRQSVRAHVQVTLSELASELVADLGLSVQATDAGPLWQRVIQNQQSDLDLLVHLADQHGLYLALREDVLHVLTLEGIGTPLPLTLGASLQEVRIEVNGEAACRAVTTLGWNPLQAKAIEARTTASRSGRQVSAAVAAQDLGGSGERTLLDRTAADPRHAEATAQAELDWRTAYQVHLWGLAEGDPRLRPGTPVTITGVDGSLEGRYVLTAVTHTLDSERGFVSEFSTVPPPPSSPAQHAVVTLGTVTRVDDPRQLGRVRVSLPAYGGTETEWMQVVSAGAGANKGLVVLPDVGDDVLLLLAGGDPGQGVILGGLYGEQRLPDSGVESGSVCRYTVRTPGGQQVQLDDERSTIRLADDTGNYVELSPSRVRVHAAVDLLLEAPGKSVTIRGRAIDFERAQ